MSVYNPFWDNSSAVLYVMMAMLGAFCVKKGQTSKDLRIGKYIRFQPYFVLWVIVWALIASLRVINQYRIGGTDAWSYITFFQNAFNWEGKLDTFYHYEIGWKIINKFIRFFVSDYRIFLFIYHSFVAWSYIFFIKNFPIDKYYQGPFILIFFIYLRGYTSFRTNASVGFLLIMLVLLYKGKLCRALIAGVLSVSIQITSLLYILIIPFWYLYKNNKLRPKLVIVFVALSSVGAIFVRNILLGPIGRALGHSYSSYASHNIGTSFLDNYWKIAIGQLFVACLLLLFNKKFMQRISTNDSDAKSIAALRLFAIFDIMTIPITFILDIWRGYEVLYLIRLLIYSETLHFLLEDRDSRTRMIVSTFVYIIFNAWLLFRILNTYETSGYMPYIPCFK